MWRTLWAAQLDLGPDSYLQVIRSDIADQACQRRHGVCGEGVIPDGRKALAQHLIQLLGGAVGQVIDLHTALGVHLGQSDGCICRDPWKAMQRPHFRKYLYAWQVTGVSKSVRPEQTTIKV